MAFKLANRIFETTTVVGTGTLNLGGAVAGSQTFVDGISTGNDTYYVITNEVDWEVGIGTVTAGSPDTLSRTTILESSNSDLAVNWSAGTKDVFCAMPGSKVVYKDGAGNLGLGVTPSAWGSAYDVLQLGTSSSIATSNNVMHVISNAYHDGTDWRRIITGTSLMTQWLTSLGISREYVAISGAADSIIAWALAKTVNNDGSVTISTELNVDNIRLDLNTISTTNTDGNLGLTPNGTGRITAAADIVMAAGKGIDFSANPTASGMTSTLFDDYEKGDWTIGISFGGNSVGVTSSFDGGYYTKVGNLVTITGYLILTNKGTSTGAANITGLPFVVTNNQAAYGAVDLRMNTITYSGTLQGYPEKGGILIVLEELPDTGSLNIIDDTNFANNSIVMIKASYRTDS